MSELECMVNYSLVPVDTGAVSEFVDTWDTQWSAVYVNDIQHNSAWIINITIPEEIDWDYSYVTWENDSLESLNIAVSGYNVDTDYIENVIKINSYRPTSQDFTSVFVGGFSLILPYIVIVLFIVFVRKLIKRIFK